MSDHEGIPEELIERFISSPEGGPVPPGLRSAHLISSKEYWANELTPPETRVIISPIGLSEDGAEAVFAAMRLGPTSARTGLVYVRHERDQWRVIKEVPWVEM